MLTFGRIFRVAIPLFAAMMLLSAAACGTQAPVAPAAALAGGAANATAALQPADQPSDNTLVNPAAATPPTAASQTREGMTAASVTGSPAVESDGSAYDVLRVSGIGIATGTPDLTNLALGVSVTDETVAEARNTAAESMTSVIAALKEQGVFDADITTSHFRIHEEYDYSRPTRRKVGYTVSNGVTVVVRQTDQVADVIDAAVAAGGDFIEFNRISFSFSDTAEMEREARQAAVADMQEKAAQLAEFAGRELGDLKALSDVPVDAGDYSRGDMLLQASAEFGRDTPISVGDDDIAAIVYGVYELK